MQHRRQIMAFGATLVVSAFLVQGAVASAGSDDPDDRSGHGHELTLEFDVQFSPFSITDLGDQGLSAADVLVFHDTLLQQGRQVGEEVGSCVVVDTTGIANCTAVVALGNQDTITYGFANAPPARKVVAITGGSGTYRTAQGDGVLLENGDAENTGTLTLTVITR